MILRFLPAERLLHWALAGPFMLLYLSAGLLLLFFGEPYPRHFHDALMIAHRRRTAHRAAAAGAGARQHRPPHSFREHA
jgi:cytochrome b subunit of formate dehydrogenase